MRGKDIILFLLLICASAGLLYVIYPQINPVDGLKVSVSADSVEKAASELAEKLGYQTSLRISKVNLKRHFDLLRYLQNKENHARSRELDFSRLPLYYYQVEWTKPFDLGSSADISSSLSFSLSFDTQGRLIGLRRQLPDSAKTVHITATEADSIARDFLARYSAFGAVLQDSSLNRYPAGQNKETFSIHPAGRQPDQSRSASHKNEPVRTDYSFTFKKSFAELPQPLNIRIELAGNMVTLLETEFDLPQQSTGMAGVLISILQIISVLVVFILALLEGIRRLRSYELGFRPAVLLALLSLSAKIVEILSLTRVITGWEFVFIIIFGPIFTGLGVLLLWPVAESISRDYFGQSFFSLDLLMKGFASHSSVGANILRGLALGGATLVLTLTAWLLTNILSPVKVTPAEIASLNIFTAPHPVLYIFCKNLPRTIFMTALFILLTPSVLRKYIRPQLWFVLISGLLFSLYLADWLKPAQHSLLIFGVFTLISILVFLKTDVLTAGLAIFTFLTTLEFSELFMVSHPDFNLSGLTALSLPGLMLAYSVYALLSRDPAVDEQRVQPLFVRHINERQRLQRELEIAREVQMSFLPSKMPDFPGLQLSAECIPAQEVGGDYYDFIHNEPSRLAVAIGDVSGKGTEAAFYMTLSKGFLKAVARSGDRAAQILKKMNRLFYENARRNTFISMEYACFDMTRKEVNLARAGHNPVLVWNNAEKKIMELTPSGIALGLDREQAFGQRIEDVVLALHPEDVFLFFTDGLTEAMNGRREEFGIERLKSALKEHAHLTAREIHQSIFRAVHKFTGRATQHDDMSLVVVKVV